MLSRYKNNGIELVIDNETGEVFATQAGYVAMSGLTQQAISKRCQSHNQSEFKIAELQTAQGVRTHNLIPAKLVFKWLIKDNPELAEKMGECGATVFLYQIAGYKVQAEQPKQEPVYFSIIEQADKAIALAERYKKLFGTINPAVEQSFKDVIGNVLSDHQPALEGKKELWMGVVNFAEVELGFNVPTKGEFRASALGKWVRFYYPELSDKQDLRLCNETQQEIWVYPIHECRAELAEAVTSFFEDAAPGTKLKLDGAFKRS